LLTALPHLTDEPEALFDEIREFVLTQGPVPIGVHYTKLFEWLRDRFGRQIWVERSGSSLAYLRELIDNFPGARFIHLFRDGRETAVSMTRHHAFRLSVLTGLIERHVGVDPFNTEEPLKAEPPPEIVPFMPDTFDREAYMRPKVPPENLAAGWTGVEAESLAIFSQLPQERGMHVRYEDLVGDPRPQLVRMSRFLGLPEEDEGWMSAAAGLIRTKPAGWLQLPEDERARLNKA